MYRFQASTGLAAISHAAPLLPISRRLALASWHRRQAPSRPHCCQQTQGLQTYSTITAAAVAPTLPPWLRSLRLPPNARIALAMSGGVDSALCAHLLANHPGVQSVTGIYMRNWDAQDETGECTSDADWAAVREACHIVGIPCERVDFVSEYWGRVFEHRVLEDGYARGRTPNPDVWCNREIKFGVMYERVFGGLANGKSKSRFDVLATGHYARTVPDGMGKVQLARAVDTVKDQSYFLAAVEGKVLPQVVFPLGGVRSKAEVKALARSVGLGKFADKKESMGICFIGKRKRFGDFLDGYIEQQPGKFVLEDGTILGPHLGLAKYTIGQSAQLASQPVKYFVARKSARSGNILLVPDRDHALLYTRRTKVQWVNWIHPENEQVATSGDGAVVARVRYQQTAVGCRLVKNQQEGMYEVEFDEPVRAVTPGQVLVVYKDDICLGCGIQVEEDDIDF
ncbi:tRNA-specific 2-thiouridylase [Catenaria anguillulae PL171]|uniref:tRNA-5-taurinomethyluridine 2-sulfurtransferase n=1 Tax=Catenaria anguillulae PL171 TaxID=765915 RepID=A0A1Y2HDU3_9FUNG|nr:tRNA-specific 2-thiouridylase [Catenaria anguillulae PL171]